MNILNVIIIFTLFTSPIATTGLIDRTAAESRNASSPIPKAIDFGRFVERYHKFYNPIETVIKCRIFLGRTLDIFKHNVQFVNKKVKYFLKQSEFIDMTPEELKKTFVIKDTDFQPVKEAKQWPNRPADEIIQYLAHSDDFESVEILESDIKISPADRSLEVDLLKEPDLNANIELDVDDNTDKVASELITTYEVGGREGLVTKKAQKVHDIKQVSYVEPNNMNFDPASIIRSYGILNTVESFAENFAKSMMDDFTTNLEFHSQARDPLVIEEDYPAPSFFESLKTITDYFSRDDDAKKMEISSHNIDDDEKLTPARSRLTSKIEPKSIPLDPNIAGEPVYMIDWRRTGCLSVPKSQGNCKSCYVFATLDLMEFFYCRQKGKMVEFSVQYVLDCGSKFNINGCSDGRIANVGRFIIERGIQLQAYMPYLAKEGECPFTEKQFQIGSPYPIKPKITHWHMFSELADWYKWLPKSPLIVGINMPADFLAYGGGVHDGNNCVPEMVHAMLLVGTGVQDGKKFWLLKNTFSQMWGEFGYFKLAQNAPINCFNSAVVARARFDVVIVPREA